MRPLRRFSEKLSRWPTPLEDRFNMKQFTMIRSLLLILTLNFPLVSLAQTGTIRGAVFDNATGEPLIGVTVQIEGTTTGAATDFDGKFEIRIDAGTYAIITSYISYATLRIE